jgi:putative hydrolase of the HAD superfamily
VIRAVLFDLWGTLIEEDPAAAEPRRRARARGAQEALARLGLRYDLADVEAAFLAAGTEHERVHARGLDLSARGRTVLYLRYLDETLPDRLDEEGWRLLDAAVLEPALEHRPLLIEGAVDALKDVASLGLGVGLISNTGATPGYVLRRILDDFGLLPHLGLTVFSDEVELAKPNAAIFQGALEEMGLAPEEAAFVGDQPVLDILGGRQAGLWVVQYGDRPATEAEPHARISHHGELIGALRDLGLV